MFRPQLVDELCLLCSVSKPLLEWYPMTFFFFFFADRLTLTPRSLCALITLSRCTAVAPMIVTRAQLVTVSYGQDVTLECTTESYPLATQEWLDPYDNKITNEDEFKYRLHSHTTYFFKVVYRLTILQVDYGDTGRYICQVSVRSLNGRAWCAAR